MIGSSAPRWLTRLIGFGSVAVLLAGIVASFVTGGEAKPITPQQAIEQFRSHSPQPPASPSMSPTSPSRPSPHGHGLTPATMPSSSPVGNGGGAAGSAGGAPAGGTTPVTSPSGSAQPSTGGNRGGATGGSHGVKSGAPDATTPAPGVYRYATHGNEQTSIPGTGRSFPATSTVTVERHGCGVTSTWQPFDQHSETQQLCVDGPRLRLTSYQSHIEFFGVSSDETFTCDDNAYVYSTTLRPGDTWSFTCKSEDSTARQQLHAVGFSSMTVGGTAVRVLHIHVDTRLTGDDAGTAPQDYWIATRQAVLVRNTGSVDAHQGGVHYQETYSLTLDSLTPSR